MTDQCQMKFVILYIPHNSLIRLMQRQGVFKKWITMEYTELFKLLIQLQMIFQMWLLNWSKLTLLPVPSIWLFTYNWLLFPYDNKTKNHSGWFHHVACRMLCSITCPTSYMSIYFWVRTMRYHKCFDKIQPH